MRQRGWANVTKAIGVAGVAVLIASCGGTTQGQAVSPLYDPFRVAGLPAEDGPSGIKDDAPDPVGDVKGTDDGDMDRLALLGVNDVADYWEQTYSQYLDGEFAPVERLQSWDSEDRDSTSVCGEDSYGFVNAFFCPPRDLMAWDRGVLVPTGKKFFGDVAVAALFGHEYGHSVQYQAGLVDDETPTIVGEQQADCFAGNYVRWVAEGNSPRFTLSTGDGLTHVLAAAITIKDQTYGPEDEDALEGGHGTALDRVSAFQIGFSGSPADCAKIDMDEIQQRRADLPLLLPDDTQTGNIDLDEKTLQDLMEVLGEVYQLNDPPKLSFDDESCDDAQASPPASYCPATNTISVDLPALQQMSEAGDRGDNMLIQGDNTGLSIVASRYALAVQKEHGEALDTPQAALRTACLTGVGQAAMSQEIALPSGGRLQLSAGDLDEAVAGLLTNGLVASNVNGGTVPAGFTRIVAFRSGLGGDADLCYNRFK